MRIGKADFEIGNLGRVHQAVLDTVPQEEAVEESELRAVYDQVEEEGKPSFEQVMHHLAHLVSHRRINGRTFYIRRKAWFSSAEVASQLGVSVRTAQAWGQKGLMGARYVGDRLRFAAEQVEDWVSSRPGVSRPAHSGSSPLTDIWDNEKDAQYDQL